MVHTYKIVKPAQISYQGVFDFKELLNVIKEFFKRHDYDLSEKNYNTSTGEGNAKNTIVLWEFDRKVDDYNQVFARLKFELMNYKEGYVDSKKIVDGNIIITMEAEVQRDYDIKWKNAPIKRFVRALYDRYIDEPKNDRIFDEGKKLIENLKKDIKQYLHI